MTLLTLLLLAQPFVERLDPPALQRGQTARLAPVGSGPNAVRGLWTSLGDKVEARPLPDGGLEVRVAADAPVGVFGVRVATADGLSNLHLALIDDLPVRAAEDGAKATLPCALWGRFREGEADRFVLEIEAGQRVSFEAVASRLGKEVDPLVTIRDVRGKLVAQHDNDPGLMFDCRFEHAFAAAGKYTVEVRDARFQGHPHGSYVLRMGRFPAARVAVPSIVKTGKLYLPELREAADAVAADGEATVKRPGDHGSTWLPVATDSLDAFSAAADSVSPATATPARVPGHLCGSLPAGGARQFFRFPLEKGQTVHLTAHGRRLNSSIDLEMALTDETGRALKQVAQGDDDEARFDFTAPKAGDYYVAVRDQGREGGPACAYRVEVRTEKPPPTVTAEVEGLTIPRGGYQVVPLVAVRNGFSGPIPLTLSGPPGITLSPTELPDGASAVVCKLSAGDAAPLGTHTVRLLAAGATVTHRPMIDRQLLNVDLIPYSLREDQRRLPPTVAGRFAVQVTDPAPFTVELAEQAVTLPRYQHAPIRVVTTRRPGFDAPITFTARGGQIADKSEGRTRVYAEFPPATPASLAVTGAVHSRILTNLGRSRIEVLATALHEGRRITLIRTFEMETRTAFRLVPEAAPLPIAPGGVTRATVRIERLPSFTGPVTVVLNPQDGLDCPEKVTVPAGKDAVEFDIKARPDLPPGRRGVSLNASGEFGGFEEEDVRGRIEFEVPKKK